MSDEPNDIPDDAPTLAKQIGAKAERKMKARRQSAQGVWFGLGMMGLIGWSVTIPTLLGVVLGLWLDRRRSDQISWTLTLLMAGLTLGCANAWYWIAQEDRAMHRDEEDDA